MSVTLGTSTLSTAKQNAGPGIALWIDRLRVTKADHFVINGAPKSMLNTVVSSLSFQLDWVPVPTYEGILIRGL